MKNSINNKQLQYISKWCKWLHERPPAIHKVPYLNTGLTIWQSKKRRREKRTTNPNAKSHINLDWLCYNNNHNKAKTKAQQKMRHHKRFAARVLLVYFVISWLGLSIKHFAIDYSRIFLLLLLFSRSERIENVQLKMWSVLLLMVLVLPPIAAFRLCYLNFGHLKWNRSIAPVCSSLSLFFFFIVSHACVLQLLKAVLA